MRLRWINPEDFRLAAPDDAWPGRVASDLEDRDFAAQRNGQRLDPVVESWRVFKF